MDIVILGSLVDRDTGWQCHQPTTGPIECHRRLHFINPPDPGLLRKVGRYLVSDAPDWRDLNPTWQGAWGSINVTRITDRIYHFHCILK